MSPMRHNPLVQLDETRRPTRLKSSGPAAAIDQTPTPRGDLGGFLLQLQHSHGNHHVQRLVERGKLRVSRSSDRTEHDADRAARALPGTTAPARGEASMAGRLDPDIAVGIERAIRQASGRGQPLPRSVRKPMEQQLDADFARVRLHTDARADRLSRSFQALAFTAGNDIFFRRGGYGPGSATGRYLLAHELTHVTQQQSGTGQPTVQRYIASVQHALRDPKGEPNDDYGTYRSLDVALEARGGEVFKGDNNKNSGGRLDQLTTNRFTVKLGKDEDLYLVGHGKQDNIGLLGPTTVAKAVAKITPVNWTGKIFSLNCWSAYRVKGAPSALEKLQELLAKTGRDISVSGPVGRSIRHKDWLKEGFPLGVKAVVADLLEGEGEKEEEVYNELLDSAKKEAGIKGKVEDAFDAALRDKFGEGDIGVENKAKFATEWGREFQTNLVKKLVTDERLKGAEGKRLFFDRSGLYENIATSARELSPGEERAVLYDPSKDSPPVLLPKTVHPLEAIRPPEKEPLLETQPLLETVHQPGTEPFREPMRSPEDVGQTRSWTWRKIAGVGLVGVAAIGVGLAGLAALGVGLTGLAALGVGVAGLAALGVGIWLIKRG